MWMNSPASLNTGKHSGKYCCTAAYSGMDGLPENSTSPTHFSPIRATVTLLFARQIASVVRSRMNRVDSSGKADLRSREYPKNSLNNWFKKISKS
jgi:hypothetical protein